MLGGTEVDVKDLKKPCPCGQVSIYIEVYADTNKPFRVTEKGFACVPKYQDAGTGYVLSENCL